MLEAKEKKKKRMESTVYNRAIFMNDYRNWVESLTERIVFILLFLYTFRLDDSITQSVHTYI